MAHAGWPLMTMGRWAAGPGNYACVVRLEKIFKNPIIDAVEKGGLAPIECT